MNKKSKNFIIIICVLFIILILCILYYVVQINIAKNYFDDGKYTKSYNSVKYLPQLFNDNLKKYELFYKYAKYYEDFEMIYNDYGFSSEEAISTEIFDLTYGLFLTTQELEKPISQFKQDTLKEIANLYYGKLYDKFFMGKSQVSELIDTYRYLSCDKIKEVSDIYASNLFQNLKDLNNKVESGIVFDDVTLSNNSLYTGAKGRITNNGSKRVYYVKIKIMFINSYGNVVDTDWTYAVGSEGLSPGESKKWEAYVDKDLSIKKIDISIIDYKK